MQTPKDLKEKIRGLETERAFLMTELEKLRKAAEMHAASLEEDVNRMKEERRILNEILAPAEEQETPSANSKPISSLQPTVVTQPEPEIPEIPVEEAVSEKSVEEALNVENVEIDEKKYESILNSLNDRERSIIEVLLAHSGKYPQRLIRTEAGLSWLETRRIVSRLSERGFVTMDNDGAENNVTLSDKWK